MKPIIRVIIPAFNEEHGVQQVLREIPTDLVEEVIVVNNASTDGTESVARAAGATVLREQRKGYGRACLKGIAYLDSSGRRTDIVIFIDADHSDYPEEMQELVKPIIERDVDIVIGSRALGTKAAGSMMPQQIFGNWLATRLLRLFHGVKFTDLGPFRAIKYDKLKVLDMQDKTFGWTVEMQVKVAKKGFTWEEIPVSYRKRVGNSKISGTVKGTVMAGYKIIWTVLKYL